MDRIAFDRQLALMDNDLSQVAIDYYNDGGNQSRASFIDGAIDAGIDPAIADAIWVAYAW